MALRLFLASLFLCTAMTAQSVSPVIVEYKGNGEGKIELTNNTQTPLVVVLEPKSFSITPEGRGKYRPLDSNIHLQLSSTSTRLQPGQTYYVFYKAKADALPAWFTIFSTFSAPRHEKGVDVRVMLPHTVYLYQKQKLQKNDIQIKEVTYVADTHKVVCDLENTSSIPRTGAIGDGNRAAWRSNERRVPSFARQSPAFRDGMDGRKASQENRFYL